MKKENEKINPIDVAMKQVDIAAEKLKLDPGLCEKIKQTKRELIVHFPVKMDDGRIKMFTGYRVQHNLTRGPGKGGIRYHPVVDLDEVRGPGHVDDLESCCGQYPLWRGKGWSSV